MDLRGQEVYFFEGAARVLELLEEEEVGDGLCEVGFAAAVLAGEGRMDLGRDMERGGEGKGKGKGGIWEERADVDVGV